ncbi:hypothetical protein [Micromonospora sp. NPDC048830]|uniref:hypothetical protein n=1 Tax=Micromonospora sp. NPDC048830 TaxID=3364257 RepID=UPI0037200CDA
MRRRSLLLGSLALASPWPCPLPAVPAPAGAAPLTNLSHLDFLRVTVAPPAQAGHTTYRLAAEPGIGVLWTYAEPDADGTYRRVGGGRYDPATDTWGRARTTPTTSPGPPWCTCATGGPPAPPPAGTRRTRCCAA